MVMGGALALQPTPLVLQDQSADSWVYAAMSERPEVFTARPWGYRVLMPWIVHVLPGRSGFVRVTLAALALSGVLLFLFLRRLGHGELPSLLAVAAFGLSAPVRESVVDPFLCEPLAALIEIAFLLAVASGAGAGVLALLAVLAAFSKEVLLALLPIAYLARREDVGDRRALVTALLAAAPALAATVLMRAWWTSHLPLTYPGPDRAAFTMALERLGRSWPETGILLYGLTPLALLGALRAKARPFLRRYGFLAVFLVLPFVAWMYDARPGRVPFFGQTVRRLLIYALPFVLALCSIALDRIRPHLAAANARLPSPRMRLQLAAFVAAVGLATVPLWALDRYRRQEVTTVDGPLLRALFRQSLRVAARLESGGRVELDAAERPAWFLRGPWSSAREEDGVETAVLEGPASIVVPCSQPRSLDVVLVLSAPAPAEVQVEVNGRPLTRMLVGPGPAEHRVGLHGQDLFRGDNRLGLLPAGATGAMVRLHRLAIEPDR